MKGIAQATGAKALLKRGGNTGDIVEAILDVIPDVRQQTAGFSRNFKPDRPGMRQLFTWVQRNIRYVEDPLGVQWIREPARLWHDREGDCKSFTVFIISVLENLGLKYYVRFANTDTPGKKIVNHVYPVAIMPDGRHIIMDAVYGYFDAEHTYYYSIDYDMADIYRLSGIGAAASTEAELEQYYQDVRAIAADIPDDVVLTDDITEMSKGAFSRYLQIQNFSAQAEVATDTATQQRYAAAASAVRAGGIAGISGLDSGDARKISTFLDLTSTQTGRAFQAPVLLAPESISGAVGSLRDVVDKVVDAVKDAWKKVVNWLFKTAMPLASPFLLYSFLKKRFGKKTTAKMDKSNRLVKWIQSAGKFDSADAVLAAARSGIIKQMGKTPEAVLNEAAKGNAVAGGVGFLPALAPLLSKAIPILINIVQKIASLFKKTAPAVDTADSPDLGELSTEYATEYPATKPAGSSSGGSAPAGIPMPLILAGAAVGLYVLTRK